MLLLANGALITWLRGEPWWLTALFVLQAALLATVRPAFYRRARLIAEPLSAEALGLLGAGAICALMLAGVAYQGEYADLSWWGLVMAGEVPGLLRFAVGLAGVLLLAAAIRLLRPALPPALPYAPELRDRLAAFGAIAPAEGGADGAVLGEGGRAGFAFVKRDGIWLALGDPAGDERDRVSAIWRFRDICERARVDPAFWSVGPALLRVYADIGLTAFPLADANGQPRYLACRAERDLEALLPLLPEAAHGD
jgi:phosphatidylglycerol lysyltransferase